MGSTFPDYVDPFWLLEADGGLNLDHHAQLIRRLHIFLRWHPGVKANPIEPQLFQLADPVTEGFEIPRRHGGSRKIINISATPEHDGPPVQAKLNSVAFEKAQAETLVMPVEYNSRRASFGVQARYRAAHR